MSFLSKGRKFFSFAFLFVFLFSTLQVSVASAQAINPDNFTPTTNPRDNTENGFMDNSTGQFIGEQSSPNKFKLLQSAKSGNKEADQILQSPTIKNEDTALGDFLMTGVEKLVAAALPFAAAIAVIPAFIAFQLSGLVLGISSYSIDLALQIGVNLMSTIVKSDADPVKKSWEIFRNIANVGIIFTILFIAIKTILRSSGYDGKVLLGRVIVAALLINFSFLFGAIVVDVSNEMSLEIYKKVASVTNEGEQSDKAKFGSFMLKTTQPSILQTSIASDLDPNAKEYQDATIQQDAEQKDDGTFFQEAVGGTMKFALSYIMGTIANLVLASVLFIAIFMIIARIIVILILLVVSPIAFAAMVLPKTQKISNEWWESLIGQSFFLPAFLLFILVGLKIAENLPEIKPLEGVENLNLGLSSYAAFLTPFIFKYMLVIGLFVAALMAAKKVQSMGSAAVGKISSSISSAAGGAVAAAGAFAGRNTVGASSNYLADKLAKSSFAQTRTGMVLLDGMKGVAKNSFDARESRAFKGVASATGVGGDFDKSFKAQKDGYTGQQKRAEDQKIKLANNLSNETTKAQDADAKTRAEAMINMVENDGGVILAKQGVRTATANLKTAKARGIPADIQAAQIALQTAKSASTAAEAVVKETAAYKAQEEAINNIGSARKKFAQNLEKSPRVAEALTTLVGVPGVSRWLPSQRASDKSAAKKIMKEKSESEKILDALRKLEDKDK